MRSATTTRIRERVDRVSLARLPWDGFADELLEIITRQLGADAAVASPMDPSGLITGSIKRELPDDSYPSFARYEYVDPAPGTFRELARTGTRIAMLSASEGDPAANPRFGDFLSPVLGIAHELRLPAIAGGRLVGGLSLFRTTGSSAFDEDALRLLRLLAPAIARGLRGDTGTSAFAELGHASLLVAPDGAVVARSANARGWLALLDPSGSRPVPVPVVTALTAARLEGTSELHVPVAGGWARVRATALVGTADADAAIVVDVEPASGGAAARLALEALGLTRREREIVTLVLEGRSTAELAARLHVSPYTVQDHLKAVFRKAGVSSRRELVATLAG